MDRVMSQSYGSDANSGRRCWGPICHCGKATIVVKSWTNDNPGRRFYRCVVHGFFGWADEEKPYDWQKISLLEARDEICHQKDEIKLLKESLKAMNEQGMSGVTTTMHIGLVNKYEEEKNHLENEVMAAIEREKMLRQFIVLSWGGFIVVIGMILGLGK
ncbi:PREDICTED: uncharacterized protein At4g04775-like [Camelina sativa]|uniref:Uncharacterized protein At4g04775-like n=1 Tax=Camelina sativa TaxID=90675 RepID=A0ABM1RS84_CAMSA|nr:PREDICTED: uncharacterized protein At4g04775-like [Camelina sativa]